MKDNQIFKFHEISYNIGYEMDKETFTSLLLENRKTVPLESGVETVITFMNCVIAENKLNNIEINNEKFEGIITNSLLGEAPVFNVDVNYDELLETYKNSNIDDFYFRILNLREAISLCILNEIAKKRSELEYAIFPTEETEKRIEEFQTTMLKIFSLKTDKYWGVDVLVDEYCSNNIFSLEKNVVTGDPFKVVQEVYKKINENENN